MADFLQFAFSGLTVGAVYALVALGFTLIVNASDVINFAQGEFVMLGGRATVFLALAGVPLPWAAFFAVIITVVRFLVHLRYERKEFADERKEWKEERKELRAEGKDQREALLAAFNHNSGLIQAHSESMITQAEALKSLTVAIEKHDEMARAAIARLEQAK